MKTLHLELSSTIKGRFYIETKSIKKIAMPFFMCDSCDCVLKKYNVQVSYYSIGVDFKPKSLNFDKDDWLYIVNFYGQISNEYIKALKAIYNNLIVDNVQAYYQMPIKGVDTLYSCRKFFGVADGAILYTDKNIERTIYCDKSYSRMNFLLGRFESSASEFYNDYTNNNSLFNNEPIKKMSKLTENLLRGIDYETVRTKRTENFKTLHAVFNSINRLRLDIPDGAFMYPLFVDNGAELRKHLKKKLIYIPILWPAIFTRCAERCIEYDMAKNILPLPIDQRYGENEMNIISSTILDFLKQ